MWILSHSRSNHRWISCSNHKGKYHEWHGKYLTENYWCWMRSSFVVCCPCFSLSLSLIFHFIKIFNFNSKECNGFKLWRRIFFKMLVFILNVAPTHKLAGAWFCTSDSQLRVLGFCIVLAFFSAGQLHLEICIALTTLHLMRTSIYAVKLMNRFIVFFSLPFHLSRSHSKLFYAAKFLEIEFKRVNKKNDRKKAEEWRSLTIVRVEKI